MTVTQARFVPPPSLKAFGDLLSRGLLSQADDVLSEAVRKSTCTPMERLEWIKSASGLGLHEEAFRRLETAKSSASGIDWWPVEVEVLMRAKKLDDAAASLARAHPRNADSPLHRKLTSNVETLRDIQEKVTADDSVTRAQDETYRTYCINLDEEQEKWGRCLLEAAQSNLTLERVPGLKGSTLPDAILPRLGERLSPRFKGTLGCFIGHLGCWEKFLKSGARHALVLEDDFRAMIRFPHAIGALHLPPGFDLCWLTWGMSTRETGGLAYLKAEEAAAMRVAPNWTANGAYGYFLSRSGAEKLMQYVSEDGFHGDVDWRLLTYSLDQGFVARLPADSHARKTMEAHRHVMKQRPPLNSFAASIWMIGHEYLGSIRVRQNSGDHYHEAF